VGIRRQVAASVYDAEVRRRLGAWERSNQSQTRGRLSAGVTGPHSPRRSPLNLCALIVPSLTTGRPPDSPLSCFPPFSRLFQSVYLYFFSFSTTTFCNGRFERQAYTHISASPSLHLLIPSRPPQFIMATHGPINGVKINRACSGLLAHIFARTRISFRSLVRIGCSALIPLLAYFWLLTLDPPLFALTSPPSFAPLRPVLHYVIIDVIITQPSTIPERWSKSLPPTASLATLVTSRTRIVKSSVMARLASSSKPNSSPKRSPEMTLPSRRSYKTSDSR
jgi:hypothetical protein